MKMQCDYIDLVSHDFINDLEISVLEYHRSLVDCDTVGYTCTLKTVFQSGYHWFALLQIFDEELDFVCDYTVNLRLGLIF